MEDITQKKKDCGKKEGMEIMIDHRHWKNVEYFDYLVILITNDARCIREIKSRTDMRIATFDKKMLFTG